MNTPLIFLCHNISKMSALASIFVVVRCISLYEMSIQRRCIDSCNLCIIIWDLFCCITVLYNTTPVLQCSTYKYIIRTLESLQCHGGQKMLAVQHQGFMQQCLDCNKATFFASEIRSEKFAIVSIILA